MANEKRLIDADALKRRMIAFAAARRLDWLTMKAIIDRIDTEDTVDAVPVVYGRWEWEPCGDLGHRLVCSVCGGWWAAYIENKYCANCGAKMHEEGKNDG